MPRTHSHVGREEINLPESVLSPSVVQGSQLGHQAWWQHLSTEPSDTDTVRPLMWVLPVVQPVALVAKDIAFSCHTSAPPSPDPLGSLVTLQTGDVQVSFLAGISAWWSRGQAPPPPKKDGSYESAVMGAVKP